MSSNDILQALKSFKPLKHGLFRIRFGDNTAEVATELGVTITSLGLDYGKKRIDVGFMQGFLKDGLLVSDRLILEVKNAKKSGVYVEFTNVEGNTLCTHHFSGVSIDKGPYFCTDTSVPSNDEFPVAGNAILKFKSYTIIRTLEKGVDYNIVKPGVTTKQPKTGKKRGKT